MCFWRKVVCVSYLNCSWCIADDLDVSPDLFSYFLATLALLRQDPSLWCVSAWNDNGKMDLVDVSSPHLLHRTDFFPGLGWMITKPLWTELAPKWPLRFVIICFFLSMATGPIRLYTNCTDQQKLGHFLFTKVGHPSGGYRVR